MSDERANALIALSRRLRTVAPKEIPIVDRGVLLAVAGRADADWIAFPPVEWIAREAGTTPNTARRALDRLVASGWLGLAAQATARTSARYRIQLEPIPPPGVTERYPSKPRSRGDGATPQGSRCDTPGVTERHPRGDGATPVDHRKIQSRSQKDPIARPRARAGAQQSLLPDLDGATATGTPLPASGVREKPAKPPREKTAGERYADAFVQAFADRGRTVSRPTTNEITLLGKLCRDHARDRAGVVLVGDALPVWIRAQVGAMVDGVDDPTRHRGGLSVLGLRHWLDTVGPVRVRELDPPPLPRPAPEAPRAPNRPPSNVTLEEAIAAIRANPYFPQPERTIAGLQAKIALRDAAKAEGQAAHG